MSILETPTPDSFISTMFTLENRKYFECTLDEKLNCVPIIKEIISLANEGRKGGALALEEAIEHSDNLFLKRGIILIVDGTDPYLLKSMLESLMVASGKCGIELLKQLVMATGLLSILAGENPRIIAEKLLFILGDEVLTKINSKMILET